MAVLALLLLFLILLFSFLLSVLSRRGFFCLTFLSHGFSGFLFSSSVLPFCSNYISHRLSHYHLEGKQQCNRHTYIHINGDSEEPSSHSDCPWMLLPL
uniref:Putative secreted protein n=1 Tax=Anopheles darlingi TaxID=43151 RepID=A0A2M4DFC2_ANODA